MLLKKPSKFTAHLGWPNRFEQVLASYNQQNSIRAEIVRVGGSGELAGQIKTEHEAGVAEGADLFFVRRFRTG